MKHLVTGADLSHKLADVTHLQRSIGIPEDSFHTSIVPSLRKIQFFRSLCINYLPPCLGHYPQRLTSVPIRFVMRSRNGSHPCGLTNHCRLLSVEGFGCQDVSLFRISP